MKIGKKLKSIRKSKKITLDELSKISGVQIATLSRIENDVMTGTLESHMSICKALGISLSDFYREVEYDRKTLSLIKQKDERQSFVHAKKSTTEMLTTKIMGKKMMPLLVTIKKGGETHKEEDKVDSEKFIYVLEGRVCAKIGKEEYNLLKGDSLYFDASLRHIFYNSGKSDARILSVLTPPTF